MNEYRVRPYKIVKPISSNAFIDTGEETIEIPWTPTEYACFLAECYEAEDEFWKELYEEIEADYWINESKNNYFENLKKINSFIKNNYYGLYSKKR